MTPQSTEFTDDVPVQGSNTPAHDARKPHFRIKKKYWKIATWIIILIAIWALFHAFDVGTHMNNFFESNQYTSPVYNPVRAEIEKQSLLGLFYWVGTGSIFVMPNPLDVIVPTYIVQTQYYWIQILTVAMIGYTLGMSFNYFMGWLVGPKILKWFLKGQYDKFQHKIDHMGGFIVVVANLIPFFPTGPFMLFLGAVRQGYWKAMGFTLIGKVLMFLLILLVGEQLLGIWCPNIYLEATEKLCVAVGLTSLG